jgi:hypothetical protein
MMIVMFGGEVKMIEYPHRLLQARVEQGASQHGWIDRLHSIDEFHSCRQLSLSDWQLAPEAV